MRHLVNQQLGIDAEKTAGLSGGFRLTYQVQPEERRPAGFCQKLIHPRKDLITAFDIHQTEMTFGNQDGHVLHTSDLTVKLWQDAVANNPSDCRESTISVRVIDSRFAVKLFRGNEFLTTETNDMQKLTPFLWFNDQAEQAVQFYTSIFKNSSAGMQVRYDKAGAKASGMPEGSVMTATFQIQGYDFVALNGGPVFQLNPSVSFFLNFDPSTNADARAELDQLWQKLSEGGIVLMPLDQYPFSQRYGWVQDRFGVSWQLILSNPGGEERSFIIPSFLFVGEQCGKAEAATDFYISIFENSVRGSMHRYPTGMGPDREGTLMYTDFKLRDQWFAAMDSARDHKFGFNEAISFVVNCSSQNEIDYYWEKLSEGGDPRAQMCGWLKDQFGVSWQVVPEILPQLISDPNPAKAQKATQAILGMKKIEIAALVNGYEAEKPATAHS